MNDKEEKAIDVYLSKSRMVQFKANSNLGCEEEENDRDSEEEEEEEEEAEEVADQDEEEKGPAAASGLIYFSENGNQARSELERSSHFEEEETTSFKPMPEQLNSLKLKPGKNTLRFQVRSKLFGTSELASSIYFWDESTSFFVTDVDGTITKSDLGGVIMHKIGRECAHPGVAPLFSYLTEKLQLKIIYLTARSIGMYNSTRDMLHNVRQSVSPGDESSLASLPDGPVIMAPGGSFESITGDVFSKRNKLFKANFLKELLKMYDLESADAPFSPIKAGFGNKAHASVSCFPYPIFI